MENNDIVNKLLVELNLKKPKGEVSQYASYGMMKWGKDEDGKIFIKWGDEEWLPAKFSDVLKEENEEEKR